MDTTHFDFLVIGAGMAGSSAAAALAGAGRVGLIEAEESAGYHTTGRSAAMWILNYGPPEVRVLTGLSRAFFEHPPTRFTEAPLLNRRPAVFLATAEHRAELADLLSQGIGLREMALSALRDRVPALKPGHVVAAAIEEDAFDIDVAALHQGFLRQLRAAGGTLALRRRTVRMEWRDGAWHVETTGGEAFAAPVVVNAAGAWGDEVARQAGVRPVGLQPKRRTAAVIDPAPFDVRDWPLLIDVGSTWYARPEARTRLLVSPADETDMPPHDVRPDELDVAVAIDRMQQALSIEVRRIEHSWAGLRTFTPDHTLAFGWGERDDGFFWCVGQGGYGIQTAPAAGRLVADLILGRNPGEAASILPATDPKRFG